MNTKTNTTRFLCGPIHRERDGQLNPSGENLVEALQKGDVVILDLTMNPLTIGAGVTIPPGNVIVKGKVEVDPSAVIQATIQADEVVVKEQARSVGPLLKLRNEARAIMKALIKEGVTSGVTSGVTNPLLAGLERDGRRVGLEQPLQEGLVDRVGSNQAAGPRKDDTPRGR